MNKLSTQSGQALLIVLLSMAVILTLVLSVLSSSITDVAVTSREEESLRAFSAAEAGVEQALIAGQTGTVNLDKSSFTTQVTSIAKDQKKFNYPQELLSGDTGVIWFIAHNDNTGAWDCSNTNVDRKCFKGSTVQLCWGNPGTPANQSDTPAMEVMIFYLAPSGSYKDAAVRRFTYDPNATRITSENSFSQASLSTCTIDDKKYSFQTTVSLASIPTRNENEGLLFMMVKSLYNTGVAHSFGVNVDYVGNTTLPAQGKKIVSTGTAGEATRKVEVNTLYRTMPSVFTNAIFSLGGITK
jgi:hypothetical protein